MDDVYTWITELLAHYRQTGEILQCHWFPNTESKAKIAREYELEVLDIALAVLRKLPKTVSDLMHITSNGTHLVVMFNFDSGETDQAMHESLTALTVQQFLRPIKVPASKLNMTKSGES